MRKYFDFVEGTDGRAIRGASVTVKSYPADVLSSLYSDAAGLVPITNPVTTDAAGFYEFYIAEGHYTLYVSGPGLSTRTITDVAIFDGDAIVDASTNAAAAAASAASAATSATSATASQGVATTKASEAAASAAAAAASATSASGSASSASTSATSASTSASSATTSASSASSSAAAAADSAAAAGAVVLGNFLQGGTGAVSRTYSNKVREIAVSVKDYGAVGDGVTDDSAAFLAALTYLKSIASNNTGYYKGSPKLLVPAGHYYLAANTLDITHTVVIEGAGSGLAGGIATKLRWAANTTGIRVQRSNTTGATAIQAEVSGTTYGGDGTIIRGIALEGAWNGTSINEGEYHGIHLRARAVVEDFQIANFQGDGIYCLASAGLGAPQEGNANNAVIRKGRITYVRNGVFIDGADANVWGVSEVDVTYARQWGFWDSSFLGCSFYTCHAQACGYIGGAHTPSTVSYGGSWYTPVVGQETGASTNAPSGTTADNTYWLYVASGGPSSSPYNVPTWTSGITVRSGGPYRHDGANAGSTFFGCYTEGGQGPLQLGSLALVVGGAHGVKISGGTYFYSSNAQATVQSAFRIESPSNNNNYALTSHGDDASKMLRRVTHVTYAPSSLYERWHPGGSDIIFCYANSLADGDHAYSISGPFSTSSWGPTRFNFPYGYGLGGKKVRPGTAAPTTGAWNQGDQIINTAPAAGGNIGWVCVTAGSPGTWKTFGAIAA